MQVACVHPSSIVAAQRMANMPVNGEDSLHVEKRSLPLQKLSLEHAHEGYGHDPNAAS